MVMETVSDEYREGYAAFQWGKDANPYCGDDFSKWIDWENGWLAAQLDWAELIGEKSV